MLYDPKWEKQHPIARVMMKAADLIRTYGLAKETRQQTNGSLCFLGAIAKAAKDSPWADALDTERKISKAIAPRIPNLNPASYLNIKFGDEARVAMVNWNNRPERTAEDVIEALETAAAAIQLEAA